MASRPHDDLPALREAARTEVGKVVLSHGEAVELTLVAALAGGHVLLEGPPGTAKTLLAYAIARVLGVPFKRVQFTPDTTPTEITGRTMFVGGEPKFEPGTLFTNVLLADEINRTPPKTQAALLEAMQEGQVTVAAPLSGRDTVVIDDVVAMAPHVLGHRIIVDGMKPLDVVRDSIDLVLPAAHVPG